MTLPSKLCSCLIGTCGLLNCFSLFNWNWKIKIFLLLLPLLLLLFLQPVKIKITEQRAHFLQEYWQPFLYRPTSNSAKSFESTCTVKTGLSDFHKLVTVLNEKHERMPAKVIQYRDYRKFDYAIFNNTLCKQTENLNFCELDFATLRKI